MKIRSVVTLVIGLLVVLGAAFPARADAVIFSNLGSNDSYNGSTGWTEGTPNGGADYFINGSAFTVGATSLNLSTIEVAVGILQGTNQLTIDLDADSGGSPGSVIESFTINSAMPPFGSFSSGNLVTATSVLNPLLTAGSQYWVVLSVPNDGTTWAAWNQNSIGDTGGFAQGDNGSDLVGSTNIRGAMRITGLSSVPEPSSMVMVSTGAFVILGYGLRRRRIPNAA